MRCRMSAHARGMVYTYVYILAINNCLFTSQPYGVLRPPVKTKAITSGNYVPAPTTMSSNGQIFSTRK
jgi:hypothetical protein